MEKTKEKAEIYLDALIQFGTLEKKAETIYLTKLAKKELNEAIAEQAHLAKDETKKVAVNNIIARGIILYLTRKNKSGVLEHGLLNLYPALEYFL